MNVNTVDSAALAQGIERSVEILRRSQEADGAWPGDYGGPLFLLPLFVATCRISGEPLEPDEVSEMLRYIRGTQNEDGGFGLHVEGDSCVYGTVANYVALRLLGQPASELRVERARNWLHLHGGATYSASWGKFFLALLGLYPYEALNPLPPELWLLPESLPVHPSKLWCHCRMVYLPMSFLYGRRAHGPVDSLILELREELYPEGWQNVDWKKAKKRVAAADSLTPQTALMRAVNRVLSRAERLSYTKLRKQALEFVLHQIEREDQNTDYICIGPINKLLNMLVWHFEEPDGPDLKRHRQRLRDYLYQAPDGLKMQGYNSSKLWDTTFAMQALLAAEQVESARDVLERAHSFVEKNQVRDNVRDHESAYRHPSKGGWPFSDLPHGWPISDCTAEGMKSSLLAAPYVENPISIDRIQDAADLLLSLQNADGGWATYEKMRGPAWLEKLNPSDCFRDIMVDYSYVECTSACLQALVQFQKSCPQKASPELAQRIARGRDYLLSQQRSDGGFEGSWGVCFSYGTWFGILGLRAAGLPTAHPSIRSACQFLQSKQRTDGGWGESVENCVTRIYDDSVESQVVMTSWAVLGLIAGGQDQSVSVRRGVEFLLARQKQDGTFEPENIAGVFNKTCSIHYDNYLKVFPLWALGEFRRRHPSTD